VVPVVAQVLIARVVISPSAVSGLVCHSQRHNLLGISISMAREGAYDSLHIVCTGAKGVS